jgi:hypothetical protein
MSPRGRRGYPRKERPENKIDGAVALIMAIGRRMTHKPPLCIEAMMSRQRYQRLCDKLRDLKRNIEAGGDDRQLRPDSEGRQ